jgi:hypothetical protein
VRPPDCRDGSELLQQTAFGSQGRANAGLIALHGGFFTTWHGCCFYWLVRSWAES